MADSKKIYWDACIWIAFINREEGKFPQCDYLVEQARKNKLTIWTSCLSLAEVFKKKCAGENIALPEEKDVAFEDYVHQDFFFEIQMDHDIGVEARKLLRTYKILKKPTDAIHLASAIINNLDEFHTFDYENILCFGYTSRSHQNGTHNSRSQA